MEDNVIDELDKNLKGIIADNELIKKENAEMKETLRNMQSLAGRKNLVSSQEMRPPNLGDDFALAIMNPENQEKMQKFLNKDIKDFSFKLETKAAMSFGSNFSTATTAVSMLRPGIIPPPIKANHIRDFIPFVDSYTRDYVYVKETGTPSGPSWVSEGSLKPSTSLSFTQSTLTTQYMAVTATISKQLLLDVDTMTQYLQSRLIQLLLDFEDTQILDGAGVGAQMGGLHLSGNYTAASGGTIDVEQLYYAIGQLSALNRQASIIILNPANWIAIQINTASTSGLYSLPPSVTVDAEGNTRILGVRVIWNTAQANNKFDVLDASGVVRVNRESPRVEFFTDSTLASLNQVFVRAELREGLAVFNNNYDIYGTF